MSQKTSKTKEQQKNLAKQIFNNDEKLVEQLLSLSSNDTISLEDTVSDNMAKIHDAYSNSLTSTGGDDKVQSYSDYDLSNDTLNWMLWMALYNDSWVFKRVIDKPSTDMVRCGYIINSNIDQEQKDMVYKTTAKYRKQLIALCKWGALFGGSVAVVLFDSLTDEDYAKPLNVAKIKKSKSMRLYVTDRWYGVAPSDDNVTNMKSIDYGKPKSYQISFADGTTKTIHHDYILRYEHREAPKLLQTGPLQNWGYAEGAHILRELSRDDQLKTAITSLINKALIEVIKMDGMRTIFMGQDEESKTQLERRLEMVNYARTFNSLTFLDKEDDYQEHGFGGLTGLSDLLETNMWQVSAAVEMQGVLFGDLKQGFSNDVDALERYDETILNRCEDFYRAPLEKFLHIIFKKYDIKEEVNFEFISLLSKKHDEEQMESIKKYQELLSGLLGDGVITTTQYAKSIRNYSNNNRIDFFIEDEDIEKLKENENLDKELENIDLDEEDINFDENEEESPKQNKTEEKEILFKGRDNLLKRIFKRRK